MATEPNPEPTAEERLNRPVRGEYFTGGTEQPRQYCVWECVDTPHAARPRGRVPKRSCGSLCITYTAKHWGHHDWQGVCNICGKKPRLNKGRILASFTLRHDADMYIHRYHSWRRFRTLYEEFWTAYKFGDLPRSQPFEEYKSDFKADYEMLMMLYSQADLQGYQKLMHDYDNDKERDAELFDYEYIMTSTARDDGHHVFESAQANVRPLTISQWRV